MLDHSMQVQPPESAHNRRKTPKIVEKNLYFAASLMKSRPLFCLFLILVWAPECRLHKVFEAYWKAFRQ